MKNLKRVLSLALATVMLLGMMVVGANAAFKDQSSIKYTEAVDTLVALGVINGMEGNTFQPNGTLTRAQAAKMVAFVKAGANESTIGYYDGTTKFTDVKANHSWASGSINYCVANNIISGMTATTYAPDATLTGAQLSKMLLVALGYVPNTTLASQNLEGANWQINAIRMAQEEGLYNGLGSNFSATRAITREEACQIIYNALSVKTLTVSIMVEGAPMYKDRTESTKSLIELAFNTEGDDTASDDFQRPATSYEIKGKTVNVVKTPTKTYTAEVTAATIYTDLGLSGTIVAAKVDVLKNGADEVAGDNAIEISKGDKTTKFGGNGTLTEVYYNKEAGTVDIVIIDTYLATVSTVTPAKNGNPATIKLTAKSFGSGMASADTFETTSFAKDDVVLFTYANSKIQSVVSANKVNGVLTSYTGTASAVVGGTTYKYAAKVVTKASDYTGVSGQGLKDEVTLYLDQYGYVLDMETYKANAESTYAYVVDAKDISEGWDTNPQVKLVTTTGTMLTVKAKENYTSLKGKLVSYTTDKDGLYVLTDATTTTKTGVALDLKKGQSAFELDSAKHYASNKTVFIVETTVDGKPVYTAYTGIGSVPSMKNTTGVNGLVATKDNVAVVVYLKGATETSSSSKDLIFVAYDANVSVTKDSVRGSYFTYKAVVNGKLVDLDLAAGADNAKPISASALYTAVSYDKNNVATLSDSNKVATTATGTTKVANGLVGLGSDFFTYTSDVVVARLADGELDLISINDVDTDDNDTVVYQVNDAGVVTGIFITVV